MTGHEKETSKSGRKQAPQHPSLESRRREGDPPTIVGAQLQSPPAGREEPVEDDPEAPELDDGGSDDGKTGDRKTKTREAPGEHAEADSSDPDAATSRDEQEPR